jgi:hypothetical protein
MAVSVVAAGDGCSAAGRPVVVCVVVFDAFTPPATQAERNAMQTTAASNHSVLFIGFLLQSEHLTD